MRTKTALLTAAIVAAGVASSMAQSTVYSLNVVGYVNINVVPGFNLITLPLQNEDATSSINSVLTNTSVNGVATPVPAGASVSTWDPAHSAFFPAVVAGGDGTWYDAGFNGPVTNPLPPGQSFFLQLPTVAQGGVPNLTITVVGSVLSGTNSYTINKGFGFYGESLPIVGDVTTNHFPITFTGSTVQTYNSGTQTFDQALVGVTASDNGTANPAFYDQGFNGVVVFAPKVGQGFIYFNGDSVSSTWTQSFNVGP